MTKPQVPCLVCGARTRHPSGRCYRHYLEQQRARNQARKTLYGGSWAKRSREARRAQPACVLCGSPFDLTLDHEHAQVECRRCNSSHRRNAS